MIAQGLDQRNALVTGAERANDPHDLSDISNRLYDMDSDAFKCNGLSSPTAPGFARCVLFPTRAGILAGLSSAAEAVLGPNHVLAAA